MRVRITTTYHLTDHDRREIWWSLLTDQVSAGTAVTAWRPYRITNGQAWLEAGKDPSKCPMASHKLCRENIDSWLCDAPPDCHHRFDDLDTAIKWFNTPRCENEGCGKALEDCWCEDEEVEA
mgnify:CR=1 FL=1